MRCVVLTVLEHLHTFLAHFVLIHHLPENKRVLLRGLNLPTGIKLELELVDHLRVHDQLIHVSLGEVRLEVGDGNGRVHLLCELGEEHRLQVVVQDLELGPGELGLLGL